MVRRIWYLWILVSGIMSCDSPNLANSGGEPDQDDVFVVVLGIAQDAGYPQINCQRSCCEQVLKQGNSKIRVSSLGIVDLNQKAHWIIDATPDIKEQWYSLEHRWNTQLQGIFITHAHIGHYTGLMQLGREALGSNQVPVYVMPRMRNFLENNGPWDQLVSLGNIQLKELQADSSVQLTPQLAITPFLVPHRDEYSETVGYEFQGNQQKILFIPDIDKWQLWTRDIREEINRVDVAFLDGSFFQDGELPGRDMSEIPHPFVVETMALMKDLDSRDKSKVHFIHLNHTNPLLQEQGNAREILNREGFRLAEQGKVYPL